MIVRVDEAPRMACGRYNQQCRGEDCMLFRLVPPVVLAPIAGEVEQHGYCGLGGRPEVFTVHRPQQRLQRGMPPVAQDSANEGGRS